VCISFSIIESIALQAGPTASLRGSGGREAGRAWGVGGAGVRLRWLLLGLDFGTDDDLQLLFAENYCLTTNDFTTELTERTEDAQRLLKRNCWKSPASLSLQGCGQQRPVAARPWPLPVGRAIRAAMQNL